MCVTIISACMLALSYGASAVFTCCACTHDASFWGHGTYALDYLTMGRKSYSTKNRVITMWKLKYTLKKIKARLEGEVVSKMSLCLLIKKYKATGSVADYRPTARPKKLKDIHYQFIDEQDGQR